jgi:hypothetical protein
VHPPQFCADNGIGPHTILVEGQLLESGNEPPQFLPLLRSNVRGSRHAELYLSDCHCRKQDELRVHLLEALAHGHVT